MIALRQGAPLGRVTEIEALGGLADVGRGLDDDRVLALGRAQWQSMQAPA